MRLINVETMRLEEFLGGHVPPYAILSHTWGANRDEVQFQDMDNPVKIQKPGYRKIELLCQQAAKDGLSFAWCDTCSIDKASSAELSESINSMFRWYQNSAVCYAYLQDVSCGTDHAQGLDQLKTSQWFTRGWTLQELLAPQEVKFYDRDWNFLGNKADLVHRLCEITSIDFGALSLPHAVPSYSIAARMSWASRRTTTRPEDQAYCMLGLLGINIPLLYGEGKNAFRRLQEELIKVSNDETIFAHSGPNILASGIEEFSISAAIASLPKEVSSPYSITNAGLSIYMRVREYEENELSVNNTKISAVGILNCHEITQSYNRPCYIGLPLVTTGIKDTYEKAGPFTYQIPMDLISAASEYRTVFIRQAMHISKITLREVFDPFKYSLRTHPLTSDFARRSAFKELLLFPLPSYEFEAVFYTIQTNDQFFRFIVIFDLSQRKAGVLVTPGVSVDIRPKSSIHGQAAFETWKSRGRPSSGTIQIQSRDRKLVKVYLTQKKQIGQFIWTLYIQDIE